MKSPAYGQRLLRGQTPSYQRLQALMAEDGQSERQPPVALHCGWGRLLIGHTYPDPASLADDLLGEQPGERDIALYVAAPHQVLARAPQQLFLDPSDTLRLWFSDYRPARRIFRGFSIRRVQSEADWDGLNRLYQTRGMLQVEPGRMTPREDGGPAAGLNPYARIIVDEANRRGIEVQMDDAEAGLFTLIHGGRRIRCRESLSDLTSAVSMTLCQDKQLTQRWLARAGLNLPAQRLAGSRAENAAFLAAHRRLVVKPVNGEQGQGVAVDLSTPEEVEKAIRAARRFDSRVLLESFHSGQDLRILVIGFEVVAAALRHPAEVIGDGRTSIRALIEAQSRRRQAASGGESRIPLDAETERVLRQAGYDHDSVLPEGRHLAVRRTANLHTGGCLEDVTEQLHPALAEAAVRAARALDIPVVGLDLLVEAVDRPDYVIIEANERAGLANHEPQPTAARFVDLLFPLSQAPK